MRWLWVFLFLLWAPAIAAQEAHEPVELDSSEQENNAESYVDSTGPECDCEAQSIPPAVTDPIKQVEGHREDSRHTKEENYSNQDNGRPSIADHAVHQTSWTSIAAAVAAFSSAVAAGAALWGAMIARRANRDQTRAYLILSGAALEFDALLKDPFYQDRSDAYWILCTVRNTGATPSGEFCAHYHLIQKNEGVEIRKHSGSSPYWGSIGPGFENIFPLASEHISRFIHESAADGRGQILLTGTLEFRTVYGETRQQDFLLSMMASDAALYIANFKEVMGRPPGMRKPVDFVPAVLDRK